MIDGINFLIYKVFTLHPLQHLLSLESVSELDPNNVIFGIDMSIEGLQAQKYSVGIFIFLILSLIFFCYIIFLYMPKGNKKLKTGEKIMFGSIIMGVILAIIIGWVQLIEGYLI